MNGWKQILKKIITVTLVLTYTLQLTAATSMPTIGLPTATASATQTNPDTMNQPPIADTTGFPTLGITSENLGLSGPLSLGATYDTLVGTVFNGQYTQKITDAMAIAALGEYGSDQYRLNGTAGFQLYPQGFFKVGAEYLSQVLPFSFDSGDINERVGQQAYGFDFQHNLNNAALRNINLGGYWAKAPNVSLDTIEFLADDGYEYINQRNLAGATSQGLSFGGTLIFTSMTTLNAALNYDNVYYHTELTSNDQYNAQGVGGTLKLNQLINDRMKMSVEASNRTIYDTYAANIAYAPPFGDPIALKMALFIQRLVSSNDTPSSNTYGLQLNFLGDDEKQTHYSLGDASGNMDITQWVEDPAVYMQRVMMVAEQITTLADPAVGSLEPNYGPITGGNEIIIHGTNFFRETKVSFNNQPGTVTYISSSELSVIVPALALGKLQFTTSFSQPVDVTVLNPNGQSTVFTDEYTYTESEASITDVSPSVGTTNGGTAVTIAGTNFQDVTDVTFGGERATEVNNSDAQTITCNTPAHDAGTVDVIVTTPAGPITATGAYIYEGAPTISNISPAFGPTAGGTSVIITGTGFDTVTDTSGVTFGGTNATSYTVNSDTQITAITPAGSAGAANVSVTNATGSVTSTGGFTYDGTPTIISIAPSSGTTAGGTSVIITGTGFGTVTETSGVTFGGTNATSYTVNSDTQITAITPAGSAGAVDVIITNATGSVTSTGGFTYDGTPTISNISPTFGPTAGGTSVIITGTGFDTVTDTSGVTFGGTNATSYTVNSDTQITAITPPGSAGAVDVIITNATGSVTSTGGFTYDGTPTIISIAPSSGTTAGGTSVIITGTGFDTVTETSGVTFGGTNATSYTVNSDTQITAITPAGSAGAVDVIITNATGSVTSTGGYTYVTPMPTVTGISPNAGSLSGNTSVTITGTNFTAATAVNFGTTPATTYVVNSATSITATSPASGAFGAVDITVTTLGGTSATSSADQFTYEAAPTVTGISPNAGSPAGNTSVTITGTNFTAATAVNFGTTPATTYAVNNSTFITATSPAQSSGTVDITVTTPSGTSTTSSSDQFTYNIPIIFLTSSTHTGNLGGLSGADTICNSDSAKPSSGFAQNYTYKALLNGNNATTSGVSYYRTNGTTLIATATGGNLVGRASLVNSISTSLNNVWTGASGTNTCNNWTSASTSFFGEHGQSNLSTSSWWNVGSNNCSFATSPLYCVSQ